VRWWQEHPEAVARQRQLEQEAAERHAAALREAAERAYEQRVAAQRAAEEQARAQREAEAEPAQQAELGGSGTVYITDTGECYHGAGCRHLRSSSQAVSRADAEANGYRPCSVCDP